MLGCLAAFEDAPEEVDVTVFEAEGQQAAAICQAAAELVAGVRSCHSPNTAAFATSSQGLRVFREWATQLSLSSNSNVLRVA